jgi:hypothetical protein
MNNTIGISKRGNVYLRKISDPDNVDYFRTFDLSFVVGGRYKQEELDL